MTVETVDTTAAQPPAQVITDLAVLPESIRTHLQKFRTYSEIARGMLASDFVPKTMKPNLPPSANPRSHPSEFAKIHANLTAAMMYADAHGLDPIASLPELHVINGKPGMSAAMKRAIITDAGHLLVEEVYSPERSVWRGRNKTWPSEIADVVIEITFEQAVNAGWTKNKDTWIQVPADMLAARCSSRVCDRVDPARMAGVAIVDELDDREAPDGGVRTITRVGAAEIQAPAPSPQAAAPAAVEASTSPGADQGQQDAQDAPPADVSGAVELIGPPDLKRVQTALTKAGIAQIDDRRAAVQLFARRDLESSKELLASEVEQVLRGIAELAKSDDPVRTLHDWLAEPQDGGEAR